MVASSTFGKWYDCPYDSELTLNDMGKNTIAEQQNTTKREPWV